jgi:hypothetical protein
VSIDDLLHNVHADKVRTTSDELSLVELEINKRRLVGAELHVRLFERLQLLNEQILRLQPEHEGAPDAHHVVREPLERERRKVEQDIDAELTSRWRDLQPLEAERRRLLREEREEHQRYERHAGAYDG